MTHVDRAAFATMMKAVFDYYGRDLSESVLEIYWAGLLPYDLAAIRKALHQHVRNPDSGQYVPKIADVEKMIGGSTTDSALVAWSKVRRAIESVGSHMTVVFDDPLIHVVIEEIGGWYHLASTLTLKEEPFRQNEFLARYRSYRLRGEIPTYPPRLIGGHDGANAAAGFPVGDENVRFIGEPRECQLVLAGGTHVKRIPLTPMTAALERASEVVGLLPEKKSDG